MENIMKLTKLILPLIIGSSIAYTTPSDIDIRDFRDECMKEASLMEQLSYHLMLADQLYESKEYFRALHVYDYIGSRLMKDTVNIYDFLDETDEELLDIFSDAWKGHLKCMYKLNCKDMGMISKSYYHNHDREKRRYARENEYVSRDERFYKRHHEYDIDEE
jgi:hypothetical protein